MFEGAVKDILLEDELFILPRYKPKDMAKLASTTQFAKHELRKIYQGFKQECPNGVCKEDSFKNLFSSFFPLGDGSLYASCVFNACKRYLNKSSINFEQFLTILSMLSRGNLNDQIEWVFMLYDVHGDQVITKDEMMIVVKAVYLMLGSSTQPRVNDAHIRQHVDRVFKEIDIHNRGSITYEDFYSWCKKEDRMQSFAIFDTVFYE
ncbi:Kv channel-interacting protein 1-like [Tetranychus urticae]|uniref:Kv channel-interacting protein 1-like n=1 Tax=Tetranychus urticae TaxID=32264 RepID=UPI00077B8B7A|nr:Kv channel-interacting protein 1-like [Tetranychus urticae]